MYAVIRPVNTPDRNPRRTHPSSESCFASIRAELYTSHFTRPVRSRLDFPAGCQDSGVGRGIERKKERKERRKKGRNMESAKEAHQTLPLSLLLSFKDDVVIDFKVAVEGCR